MTTPAQVVALAKGEVGYVEGPPPKHNGNLTKYGAWYGLDGQPWCAMFVSFLLWSAGLPLPITTPKGFAYCPFGVSWFKQMGLWTATGRGRFYAGDVVFFQFDADAGADHVGIITETRADSVLTVEGNTSPTNRGSQSNGGGVYERERPLSLILGVGRPQYSPAAPTPAPAPSQPPAWPGRFLTLTTPHTRGADVRQLQRKMNEWGSKLAVDGDLGVATYNAVRWWQAALGLHVDGVVGRETWAAFFRR